MNFDAASGVWTKTVRLLVGGQSNGGVAGAYQYKINENGVNTGWRADPLNPRKNSRDNDNSYLYVRNPTIHYLLPNSLSPIVKTRQPVIEAYLFPATQIKLRASRSTDRDGQALTFSWQEDVTNPQALGVNGAADSVITVTKPQAPGEYYFTLTARDPNGNLDRTRQFFTVTPTGRVIPATSKSNPAWVKQARVYEIFVDTFTPPGTLKAATAKLNYIKAMGFNVIWLMPIFDNNFRIDGVGAGYDIVDFYNVAPEFGTNANFRDFTDRAHQLGIHVVLDVTPNHTSQVHAFAADVQQYRENSRY